MSTAAERRRQRILAGGTSRMNLVTGQMKTTDFASEQEQTTTTSAATTQHEKSIDDIDDDMTSTQNQSQSILQQQKQKVQQSQHKPLPQQHHETTPDGHEFVTFSSDDDNDEDDQDNENNDDSDNDSNTNNYNTNSINNNDINSDDNSDNNDEDEDVIEFTTPQAQSQSTIHNRNNTRFTPGTQPNIFSMMQQQQQQQQYNRSGNFQQQPPPPMMDLGALFGMSSPMNNQQSTVITAEKKEFLQKMVQANKISTMCFYILFTITLFALHLPYLSNLAHDFYLYTPLITIISISSLLHCIKGVIYNICKPSTPQQNNQNRNTDPNQPQQPDMSMLFEAMLPPEMRGKSNWFTKAGTTLSIISTIWNFLQNVFKTSCLFLTFCLLIALICNMFGFE